jgi:hypothetical protein
LPQNSGDGLLPLSTLHRIANADPCGAAGAQHTVHNKTWMTSGAEKVNMLVYVSASSTVCVYDYQTGVLVGTLSGFTNAQGQCVDKRGNVWITDSGHIGRNAFVDEYAHGKSQRLRTLPVNGVSVGCSIDPTSGNLAVSTSAAVAMPSELLVFQNAEGSPTVFQSSSCGYAFGSPGYDDNGNLYVEDSFLDGEGNVCELPQGATSLRAVTVYGGLYYSGGSVMWDGKDITFSAQYGAFDYRTAIYEMSEDTSGNLTRVGETVLNDDCEKDWAVVAPFIVGTKNTPENRHRGKVVVGVDGFCATKFGYWKYPAGGLPQRAILRPENARQFGQHRKLDPVRHFFESKGATAATPG